MEHDLVCSFEDLVDSEVSQDSLNGVVLEVAITSMHLKGVVHDVETLIRCKLLSHGAVHCVVRVSICDTVGAVSHHKSARLEVCGHFGELELNVLIVCQWPSKLLPLFDVISGDFQALGGTPNGATSNIKSATIESCKSDLES